MLVTTENMLQKAQKQGYAIGHFNTSNLEITRAIIDAANELNSPVIVATTKSAIEYAGIEEITAIVKVMANKVDIPVALHLDHSPDFSLVKAAIENNYTSVMIDASRFEFKKNVKLTKEVVKFAHENNIPVEAELGRLLGKEDWVESSRKHLTNPDEAKDFVNQTNCDSLAVSIGTSHGAFKASNPAELDINRLEEINEKVNIPLVLHGASGVSPRIVKLANKYGADITGAHGIEDFQIKKAIQNGICKVNTDTDLRIAFDYAERRFLQEHPKIYNPREILSAAFNEIKIVVKDRVKLLGSTGKA